jgi:hypothetical protein
LIRFDSLNEVTVRQDLPGRQAQQQERDAAVVHQKGGTE